MEKGHYLLGFCFSCHKYSNENLHSFKEVRVKGLEPPHLAAPDPKSGVSTNSTTPAM